jgi:hypothetical protein
MRIFNTARSVVKGFDSYGLRVTGCEFLHEKCLVSFFNLEPVV